MQQDTNKENYIDLLVYDNQEYGTYLFHPPAEMTDPYYNYVVQTEPSETGKRTSYLVISCRKKKNFKTLLADKTDLVNYLNRLVKEQMNPYGINADEYVKVYIADQELYTKTVDYTQSDTESEIYYSGFGGGYVHGTQALFYGPDVIGSSLAHELLHAIGLEHSFSTYHKTEIRSKKGELIRSDEYCKNALYTYQALQTDNIMDYSDSGNTIVDYLCMGDKRLHIEGKQADNNPNWITEVSRDDYFDSTTPRIVQYTTWHWQWKVVQDNISKDGIITHAINQKNDTQ